MALLQTFNLARNLFGAAQNVFGQPSQQPKPQQRIVSPVSSEGTLRAAGGTFSGQGQNPAFPASRSTGQVLGTQAPRQTPQFFPQGGGQPPSTPGGDLPQNVLEQQQQAPDYSFFEQQVNPAIEDLNRLETESRSLLGGGEQQAEAFQTAELSSAEREKAQATGQIESQERQGVTAAQEAEAQQRRGFSEISQQFLGKYGKTGFGQGVTGSLAESTLQNLGRIKTGLQNFQQDLESRANEVNDIFAERTNTINFQAEQIKQEARANLQQAMAAITAQRGQLQVAKAQAIQQSLDNYRGVVQQVNARNAAFQQSMYQQRQAALEQINQLKIRSSMATAELPLPSFELSSGQSRIQFIQPGSNIDRQIPEGTQISSNGVNFVRQDNALIATSPLREKNDTGIPNPYDQSQ